MPISDKHNLIFIHIAKNAGTSIVETLEMENLGHHNYVYYQKKYSEKWKTYRKFAIVRNSWDRFVSSYEYARMPESHWHSISGKTVRGPHPDYLKVRDMNFEECADALLNDREKFQHQSWLPQKYFIHNGEDFMVDMVLDFGNIAAEISSKMGFAIPVMNKSRRTDYRRYYNQTTIDIISEIYKEDIELFNFTYESDK